MTAPRPALRLLPTQDDPARPAPLWRELVGAQLRRLRRERNETLSATAERAGISPQYLSEIERGRKDPSSEMLAAACGALGVSLLQITTAISGELRSVAPPAKGRGVGPTCLAA